MNQDEGAKREIKATEGKFGLFAHRGDPILESPTPSQLEQLGNDPRMSEELCWPAYH